MELLRLSTLVIFALVITSLAPGSLEAAGTAGTSPNGSASTGPVIQLGDWTFPEAAVLDSVGQVHLISGKVVEKGGVHLDFAHITVDREGKVVEEPIVAGAPYVVGGVAAAFDAAGVLRVSVDGKHYRRLPNGWTGPESGPRCQTMIQVAGIVVCAIQAPGKEHREVGLLGIVPLPVTLPATKLLLLRETGSRWLPWKIVDPDDQYNIGLFQLAADQSRGLHLLYIPMASDLNRYVERNPRYAHLTIEGSAASAEHPASPEGSSAEVSSVWPDHDTALVGTDIKVETRLVSLAVDPESGHALGASSAWGASFSGNFPLIFTVRDGVAGVARPIDGFAGSRRAEAHLAPAGHDRFLVLLGLTTGAFVQKAHLSYYLLSGDQWSGPIDFGEASSSRGKISGFQVVADKGDVFVTWIDPADNKLRGRWLHVAN
jgi:hypothetical protein